MTNQGSNTGGQSLISGEWYKVARVYDARQSKNTDLPKWLRIAHYCYANMKPGTGGKCPTSRGELARFLGVNPNNVAREVRKAVQYRYLSDRSTTDCLVAPPYDIEMLRGRYGG